MRVSSAKGEKGIGEIAPCVWPSVGCVEFEQEWRGSSRFGLNSRLDLILLNRGEECGRCLLAGCVRCSERTRQGRWWNGEEWVVWTGGQVSAGNGGPIATLEPPSTEMLNHHDSQNCDRRG